MMNSSYPRYLKILLYCLVFILALLHVFIVCINHFYFKTYAFDYGVYNFAFYDFAHLRVSACPVYMYSEPVTFLQDHFSLTLLLFSPFYWILTPLFETYTLLVIQWLSILFGGLTTYKLIKHKTQNDFVSLVSVIYYLTLYGRFSSYQADCNLVIVGSAFLPAFIYYFEMKKWILSTSCFIFILLNREDTALTIFFISLMLFIVHYKERQLRIFAIAYGIAALVFFSIVFQWIIPALEDSNKKYSLFNYEALGGNPLEVLAFILRHPLDTLQLFFVNHTREPGADSVKWIFYLVYFISGGFVLIFRPVYLIAFIPLIAKKMLNDESFRWGHEGYNGVEVAALLPILVFSILSEFKSKTFKWFLILISLVGTIGVSTYYMLHMSPSYYGFNKYSPLSPSLYSADYPVQVLNKALKQIPDTAAVSASGRVLPHLAFREKIYHFPQIKDAEYVVICKLGSLFPVSLVEFNQTCDSLKTDANWQVLFDQNDCLLIKRKKPSK